MKKEITEQLYLKSNAPLDAKLTPVDNVSDLNNIPRSDRYLGMTIVVLNKGTGEDPCEYWLPKTTGNAGWAKKENGGQPIDLKDYYTSAQTDSAISIAVEELEEKIDKSVEEIEETIAQSIGEVKDDISANTESIQEVYSIIEEDEEILANAVTQLNAKAEQIDALSEDYEESQEVIAQAISEIQEDVYDNTEAINEVKENFENYYTSGETEDAIQDALSDIIGSEVVQSAVTVITEIFEDRYYTSAQTDNAIAEALESFTGGTTTAETQQLIEAAMAHETARTETTYLKEHQSLADYYTSAQTDSAISEAVEELRQIVDEDGKIIAQAFALETARTETTYLKEHQSLADYYTSAQTDSAITNLLELIEKNGFTEVVEDGLYFVDGNGYIAMKITNDGVDTINNHFEIVSDTEYQISI